MRQNTRVKVFPGARENSVIAKNGELIIRVTAPAEKGKANIAALVLMAGHLGVPKSSLHIIKGETARKKLIAIG